MIGDHIFWCAELRAYFRLLQAVQDSWTLVLFFSVDDNGEVRVSLGVESVIFVICNIDCPGVPI